MGQGGVGQVAVEQVSEGREMKMPPEAIKHVNDLARRCAEVINSPNGLREVLLVIPGPAPRGKRVRLVPGRSKCPMGEPVNWQEDPPRIVAYFDAMDVLAWLAANNLVKIKGLPSAGGVRKRDELPTSPALPPKP